MRVGAPLAAALALSACGGTAERTSSASAPPVRLALSSPAFADGAMIPRRFTCDGQDISPPLTWSGIPPEARELTLVMRDPDAPGGNFIHWSLAGISPATSGISAGRLPAGAVARRNSFGSLGYRGPCPPPAGRAHRYLITLRAAAGGAVVGSAALTGLYARR